MDSYITGNMIKKLREAKGLTQAELASLLAVSDKSVSKWETGKGYPDITLIEPLASALGVSAVELLSGDAVLNTNKSFNMKRSKFYVCPICGNVLVSSGNAVVCCHGITLPPIEFEECDSLHGIKTEPVEDEIYLTVDHDMTKEHYISFFAALTDDKVLFTKLYPEQNAAARFKKSMINEVLIYCNKHGGYKIKL